MSAVTYEIAALLSNPHTGRDQPVTAGIDFSPEAEDPVRSVWIFDAAATDLLELPRTQPAGDRRAWVIDLAPHGADDQAADDALRAALHDFGWHVL